jgi:hypothetical protein
MADIFYAKEIMKNINNSTYHDPNGKPLRKIRGLYVTGVWRPPHNIERHLFVTDIGSFSLKANIESFTEDTKHVRPSDYLTAITEFKATTSATFVRFTKIEKHQRPGDYLTAITEFKSLGPPSFYKFTTVSKYVRPSDYLTAITEFKATTSATFVPYYIPEAITHAPGKPSLQIKSISGTQATVEDAT